MYTYIYNVGPIPYRNVMYLTMIAQRRWMRTKLYWSKKMTLNPQEKEREPQRINKKVY